MRVYELTGDFDLAWVNFLGGKETFERLRSLWFDTGGDIEGPVGIEFSEERRETSTVRRFDSGKIMRIDRYALRSEAIGEASLFRLTSSPGDLLCTDAFQVDVERHGLTGFSFREVWSSDGGGVLLDNTIPVERVRGEFAKRARSKPDALRAKLAAIGASQG